MTKLDRDRAIGLGAFFPVEPTVTALGNPLPADAAGTSTAAVAARVQQRMRMLDILRRHVRAEDGALSDHDFIGAVWRRYSAERGGYLVDPAE